MIYTCTFNPSIDHHVSLEIFNKGGLNRTIEEHFQIGGKGINVSMMLNNLGIESTVLGFVGGFTGEFIKTELERENIKHRLINVDGITRINTKMKTLACESEINSAGPIVNENNIEELRKIVSAMNETDVFVLAGNPSAGSDKENYSELAKLCVAKEVDFIVDSTKYNLESTLRYQPLLVKPNIHELEELFETSINTIEDLLMYAKKLKAMGPKNIIVSLGKDGAILLTDQNIYKASAPMGKLINSVGSGDSMVAGFIKGYVSRLKEEELLKLAVACGSASAFSQKLASEEKVEKLFNEIKVEVL